MPQPLDQFASRVLGGEDASAAAGLLRAALAVAEPPYAAIMLLRNALYDRGILKSHPLGRPTVSVGNLTAGGTGKTPVVRWLADALAARGFHPAVLLRGYMRGKSIESDEAALLRLQFRRDAESVIEVEANPDRPAGAAAVLSDSPQTDLFIMDDAFQHRRAQRDFDLVLIDATNPFGFGHVHPRGLLREPRSGLKRADAILLTRVDLVRPEQLDELRGAVHRWNSRAPIFASSHEHSALIDDNGMTLPVDELARRRFFAFGGIARPDALDLQLRRWGDSCAGARWFGDHHAYRESDMREILDQARAGGATMLLTTGKDRVKLDDWIEPCRRAGLPLHCIDLAVRFADGEDEQLIKLILQRIPRPAISDRAAAPAAPPRITP